MMSSTPKALVDVNGVPLIRLIVGAFASHCTDVTVVTRPGSERAFETALSDLPGVPVATVTQPDPIGTADAIARGIAVAEGDLIAVVWGDHIGAVRFPDALDLALTTVAGLILPLVMKRDPYVYFTPDDAGRRIVFHETKSGAPRIAAGHCDCGVLLLRRPVVGPALDLLLDGPHRSTPDLNFLAVIADLPALGVPVETVVLNDDRLTLGVNTPAELADATGILGLRGAR